VGYIGGYKQVEQIKTEQMKYIFIVFFVLSIQSSFAQIGTNRIDKEYFLAGTLSDYMGRSKSATLYEVVECYNKNELPLVLKLDSNLKVDYPELQIYYYPDSNIIELRSRQLTERMNKLYSFKSFDHLGRKFSTYIGKLKPNKFKTSVQKNSFIAGIYTRFGVKNDTTYCIRMFNSYSKAKLCASLLKKMGGQNVQYIIISGCPVSHIIYFNPTIELEHLLSETMYLKD
jgi:hypothetical protein